MSCSGTDLSDRIRMAQKRKRKINRLRSLLLFILTPVLVWVLAFVVWIYWNSITPLFRQEGTPSKAQPKTAPKIDQHKATDESVKEQISGEERKKLDEILKNRAK